MTIDHHASLYQSLGGAPAIAAAVDSFYERVLADASLAPAFAGIPLSRLKHHQRAFLTRALGGPAYYAGRDMRAAHVDLAITDEHFDRVAQHLAGTLTALGVDAILIAQVIAGIASLRAEIVTVKSPDEDVRLSA
jgi:hemoglobin